MKTTTTQKLAEFVIIYCNVNGLSITPLKLQKLLYYIQAWHIVKFEKEHLFDELPEAWVNGPVYRSVYNTFKSSYRNEPIYKLPKDTNVEGILTDKKTILNIEEEQSKLIDAILKFYGPQSEDKLVLMTHYDAPWNEAREGLEPFARCTKSITVDSMYNFYFSKTKNK